MFMKSHEEMIQSLYARREAYERKKAKGKRAMIQVTGIAACFVLCTAVLLGSYGQSEPPVTPAASEESEQISQGENSEGDLSEGESEVVSEPSGEETPSWLDAAYASYAVAELLEITDNKVTADDGTEYTAVKCNVINSYRAEEFAESGWVYIVTPSAQKMSEATTIFFELEKMIVGDEFCYTTSKNEEGAFFLYTNVMEEIAPSLNELEMMEKLKKDVPAVSEYLESRGRSEFATVSFDMFSTTEEIQKYFNFMTAATNEYEKTE